MRILIADDEAATRDFLKVALQGDGHDIVMAQDGAAAWSLVSSDTSINIVLSDISMPEMDGVVLAGKILDAGLGVRVILMSGLDSEIARVDDLKSRGVTTLLKPFSLEQVRTIVGTA